MSGHRSRRESRISSGGRRGVVRSRRRGDVRSRGVKACAGAERSVDRSFVLNRFPAEWQISSGLLFKNLFSIVQGRMIAEQNQGVLEIFRRTKALRSLDFHAMKGRAGRIPSRFRAGTFGRNRRNPHRVVGHDRSPSGGAFRSDANGEQIRRVVVGVRGRWRDSRRHASRVRIGKNFHSKKPKDFDGG